MYDYEGWNKTPLRENLLLALLCILLLVGGIQLLRLLGVFILVALFFGRDARQSTNMDVLSMMALPLLGLGGTVVAAIFSISFWASEKTRIWSFLIAIGLDACAAALMWYVGYW